MKKIFLLAFTLPAFLINAQTPNLAWAKKVGSTNSDVGQSIIFDVAGNVYATGYFNGTADFDPGAGVTNLTSAGNTDGYICKLNAAGDFVWAMQIGGTGPDAGNSINTDAAGNIYVTGYFSGTADLDPSATVNNLTSFGGNDIFIIKMDTAGNFSWAKQMGGATNEEGRSITADASGNIFTTGFFTGTADFDPGASIVNLISPGSYQVFVSKLDAPGNYVWAKQLGGPANDLGYSIATDASGNVYTSGHFSNVADFDPDAGVSNLTAVGGFDMFISKLDALGNFSWAKQTGSALSDAATSIAVDLAGNVYSTGYFFDTIDFDPGPATYNLSSAGVGDIYASKFDAAGNLTWAKNLGGSLDDFGYGLALDATGNIYITGFYAGTADFDPGAATYNLYSYFPADSTMIRDQAFVSKLDNSGNFVWAGALGGIKGHGIAATTSSVYSTGYFTATADFDPATSVFNLTTSGSDDIYFHKIDQSTLVTNENFTPAPVAIYPNPTTGIYRISSKTIADVVIITDVLGNEVMKIKPSAKEIIIDMSNHANGIYFVHVIAGNTSQVNKVVVDK